MSDLNCVSCNAPISPAFKAALRDNICPGCGDSIFTESAQEIMQELKNAMEEMPNDPQGLAGWLMSNYKMVKVGDGEPTGFYGNTAHAGPEANSADLKVAPNKLQQFLKAANVKPAKRDMSALANQIRGAGSGADYDGSGYDMEVNGDDYPDESNYPEFTKGALGGMIDTDQQMSSQQKAALISGMSNEDKDISEEGALHPALDESRKLRLAKQQDLVRGGSVGKISRS